MSDTNFDELPKSEKSWMVVLILHFVPICSCLGAPQWYLGNVVPAIVRIIPLVGWILAIVDLVKLFQGKLTDSEGNVVRK